METVRGQLASSVIAFVTLIACSSSDEPTAPPAPIAEEPVPAPAPADAAPPTCLETLSSKGVAFERTTARGVVDAVVVSGPIGGVLFAKETEARPSGDPMACSFVLRMLDLAAVLKARGVSRVGTLGAYCYRCCCAWSEQNFCRGPQDAEPDCRANGYSNHSWGRALDVRYVFRDDGTRLDINDAATWVKTAAAGTCSTGLAAQKGNSKFLYELACAMWDARVFATILTPNYNAAHRNHWHLDTGEAGEPQSFSVKSYPVGNRHAEGIDVAAEPDRCGDE